MEWGTYTDKQHRNGRGRMWAANNYAEWTFEDGRTILTPLRHHTKKPEPDWQRAARCAVRFYRLKIAAALIRRNGSAWGCPMPGPEERHAAFCQVPAFARGVDPGRGAEVDVEKANSATHALRYGLCLDWQGDAPDAPGGAPERAEPAAETVAAPAEVKAPSRSSATPAPRPSAPGRHTAMTSAGWYGKHTRAWIGQKERPALRVVAAE